MWGWILQARRRAIPATIMALAAFMASALFTPRVVEAAGAVRVVVDAGHGGKDPGAISPLLPMPEKDVALDVALRLGAALRRRGMEVTYTRTDDRDVGLAERAALAPRVGAQALVSIHLNSAPSGAEAGATASGAEGWYGSGERDAELAAALLDGTAPALRRYGMALRGTRAGPNLAVLRTPVPAALIELGYVTSPTDAAALATSQLRSDVAEGLADGLVRFSERRTQATPRVMLLGMGGGAGVGLPGTYFVKPGDTLRAIASHLGVPHQALRLLDGGDSPVEKPLLVGQPLKIAESATTSSVPIPPAVQRAGAPARAPAAPVAKPSGQGVYVVTEGDTLTRIAKARGVTVKELAAWNGLADADLIVLGQRLLVAREAAEHTMQPGETLSAVALRWGTTSEAIRRENGLRDANHVEVGRVLARPKE